MNDNISKKNKNDHAVSLVKAVLSTAPFTGGIASLISDYLPNSVEKRKAELLIKLSKDLENLENRYNEDTLKKDYFISTFIAASKGVIENHDQEKVNAFRAIILNTLIAENPKEDEVAMFIGMTQRLTPLHIKLLKILRDPKLEIEKDPEKKSKMDAVYSGGISTLTSLIIPQYSEDLVKIAFQDLYNMGLHSTSSWGGTMSAHGITQKRTSEFGDKYIDFITLPENIVE